MIQILRFDLKIKSLKLFASQKKWKMRNLKSKRFMSYKHIGGEAFIFKTIGGLLEDAARHFPESTAFVSGYQKKRVTFQEANEMAEKIAAGLFEMGISPGDRVALWAPNSLEWYITSFALAKAGAISVYLNPAYQTQEIKHCLNTVGVRMLVMADSFKGLDYFKILDELEPKIFKSQPGKLKSKVVPSLETVVCFSDQQMPGMLPFESIAERSTEGSRKKVKEVGANMNPDEPSNIQFTSGTTGSPKGAVLNHFGLVNNAFFTSRRMELHLKKHIICFMGPLFHALGSAVGILCSLLEGLTLVIPDVTFSSSKAAETIIKEKCTVLLGTPTMYIDIIKVIQENNWKVETVQIGATAGAHAPSALIVDMKETLGLERVVSLYGMTESGPITFMSTKNDNKEQLTTTVGYIMEHTEGKVVDSEGKIVPWNTPGELWVRSYGLMVCYWNDEKKTKETINSDGWLKTGDQFMLGEDGYAKIVGRVKDMIIRGGENIYPADIEEFLSQHSEILEVQVIGIPDQRLGETVCACIRLTQGSQLTEEKVKEFCRGKIADFKIPAHVYFAETFPKTSSGKVQKFLLRTEVLEYLKKNNKIH